MQDDKPVWLDNEQADDDEVMKDLSDEIAESDLSEDSDVNDIIATQPLYDNNDKYASLFSSATVSPIPQTEEEEIKMTYEVARKSVHDNCRNHRSYDLDELIALMKDYHSDDPVASKRAKNLLTLSVTCMVINVAAKKYPTYYKRAPMDLFQSGMVGVATALQNYDPEARGTKLTTWIIRPVVHEMQDFINKNFSNATTHYGEKIRVLTEAIRDKERRNIPYTDNDLAIETNLPLITVRNCLNTMQRNTTQVSIDDSESYVGETLKSQALSPEKAIEVKESNEMIANILAGMDKLEAKMIIKLFGLDDGVENRTDQQVCDIIGIKIQNFKALKSVATAHFKKALIRNKAFQYSQYARKCQKTVNLGVPVSTISSWGDSEERALSMEDDE